MLLSFQSKGHKAIWVSKTKATLMSRFKEIMKREATDLLRLSQINTNRGCNKM